MSSFATNSTPVKLADGTGYHTTVVPYHPSAIIDSLNEPRTLKCLEINDSASIAFPTNALTPDLALLSHTIKTIRNASNIDAANSREPILGHQVHSPFKPDNELFERLRLYYLGGGRYANFKTRYVIKKPSRFTIFDELPTELRNKIWIEAASNEPRNIYAIEHPAYRNGGVILDSEGNVTNPADSTWKMHVLGATITNVLASCKGAYDAVTKVGIYRPMLQMKNSNRAYYINPEIDRIHLDSSLPLYGLVPCGTLTDYLVDPHEVNMIRRAALPLCLFENEHYWCIFSIESLFNLEEFRLVQHVRHRAQTIPFKLVLDFESNEISYLLNPADDTNQVAYRTEAKPVYQGLTHMNAMRLAFSYIAEDSECDRLMDIWPLATQAFELVPHLKKITVCVTYTN
jgi:hypothetical protein